METFLRLRRKGVFRICGAVLSLGNSGAHANATRLRSAPFHLAHCVRASGNEPGSVEDDAVDVAVRDDVPVTADVDLLSVVG